MLQMYLRISLFTKYYFLINILSVLNKMSKIKYIEAIVIAKPQLLLAMVL